VLVVEDGARLDREAVCDGRIDSDVEMVDEEPATLGLRADGRRFVATEVGATDCRLGAVDSLGLGLGAMTLDGRGFGAAVAGFGLGAAIGLGGGCEIIRVTLPSLMKRP
jgi:hypothetical protein